MHEKLELLAIGSKYKIEKDKYDDGYIVIDSKNELTAFIASNSNYVEYYKAHCYNSGVDLLEIDVEALMELKTFCELMVK